jgi:imidazolonepropionase-like amidohydrolase
MLATRCTPLRLALVTALLAGACAKPPAPQPAAPPRDSIVAITNATLWTGTGAPAIPNSVTLVKRSRILCAGTASECAVPPDARVIDANNGWLIPGLIDSHVHLLFLERGSAGEALANDLKDLLAQGITAVRDMGTNPKELLARSNAQAAAPRVYAMQLVAGFRFFYGREAVRLPNGSTGFRLPQAQVMQLRGWTPMMFNRGDDPDSLVQEAKRAGAVGLKLYAYLDSTLARQLVEAAHRADLPAWGHAWVQPASPRELMRAGEDGLVHASLFVGDLLSPIERDSLLGAGAILEAGAQIETAEAAHDPRIGETLDSMAKRGTFLEPTLDVTLRSVAHFDAKAAAPSISESFARAAVAFSMGVTREAVQRGVRITAGTDHVAYGPIRDRATLHSELQLLVDSIGLSPQAALLAATRDAAAAIGGEAARELGTIEPGRQADLVLLRRNPLEDIRNLETVEWVMRGGTLWRPWQLRSGIALSHPAPVSAGTSMGEL